MGAHLFGAGTLVFAHVAEPVEQSPWRQQWYAEPRSQASDEGVRMNDLRGTQHAEFEERLRAAVRPLTREEARQQAISGAMANLGQESKMTREEVDRMITEQLG